MPLVFHIISKNPSLITDQQIQDAVQGLNDAFAHAGFQPWDQKALTDLNPLALEELK